jgi:coenzyme PQQ precursor peptide PqqA
LVAAVATRHVSSVPAQPAGGRRLAWPAFISLVEDPNMTWQKPEFEVVEVTMEVTAYVARR